jgi:hypothetical protein
MMQHDWHRCKQEEKEIKIKSDSMENQKRKQVTNQTVPTSFEWGILFIRVDEFLKTSWRDKRKRITEKMTQIFLNFR